MSSKVLKIRLIIDKVFDCIGELSLKDFKASMQLYQAVKLFRWRRKGREGEEREK